MSTDAMNTSPRLSVCMIVKNEASLLGRCLASVQQAADEIVVVDTGSTDGTAAIARQFGAKVCTASWQDDFAAARNISIENADGVWILWLDADDVVPPATLPLLAELKMRPPDRVYGFVVRNERPGNTGTEFNQARMFPNRSDLRFERRIHEQIMPSALRAGLRLEQCGAVVEHHGYAEPSLLKQKAERNIRLLLQEYSGEKPDSVTATEIADSYTLIENEAEASRWYRYVLALPGVEEHSPVLAGHAFYGLGVIANKQERFVEAIGFFGKALHLTPWRTDVLYSLAVAYEFDGNLQGAVDALHRIFTITPQAGQVGVDFRAAVIKAYLRLTRLLTEMERFDEAAEVLQTATIKVAERPEIHAMAGKFYLKTGKLMEALHAFEKSILLRREGNTDAFIGLCCIYRRVGRNEKVEETLTAVAPMFAHDERFSVAQSLLTGTRGRDTPHTFDEGTREMLSARLRRDFFGMI